MYTGRFAPTPSGPLHLGSLFVALASYIDARAANGRWIVRIDDLDTPRNAPGADEQILNTLAAHGLHWDAVERQSAHDQAYARAVERLRAAGLTYRCTCSRKQLAGRSPYPGTCRDLHLTDRDAAERVVVPDHGVSFRDLIQGEQHRNLARTTGDFVVVRRDGQYGYHLSCIVDEDRLGITRVVRGADLMDSTMRQLYLAHLLELRTPEYLHLPVITERHGDKLSKQTRARSVESRHARDNVLAALFILNLGAPPSQRRWRIPDLLRWACEVYALHRLPAGPVIETVQAI